ncbi:hypothetical protein BASA60_007987 [Batrachochytrium salamandrivorans]|nr:hypothetical protein BASA60_007987 [Batrachochytrium salamandrivorans]
MANLEDIVASLTDRLRSLELKTKPFNKEFAPTVYVNQRRSPRQVRWLPQTLSRIYKPAGTGSVVVQPLYRTAGPVRYDLSSWSAFKARMKATFGEINQEQLTADIDWNDAALRSQFYSGLSSEIKDHLVHCESPVSLAAAMDQAIRIDNRIFERRQEQQYNSSPIPTNPPPSQPVSSHQLSAVPTAIC